MNIRTLKIYALVFLSTSIKKSEMVKKVILTVFCIAIISITVFAQQKKYGSKTIGQWTLEKFPLHYSTMPSKTMTFKNKISGKLEMYEEQNTTGQTNGLKLIMRPDGINPENAIYIYKGEIVYMVNFFPSSKIAQQITTYDVKGQKDGYTINRTLKKTGGYTERIEKYENDKLVELNGVKQVPFSLVFVDSLLHGKFKFRNPRGWVIEGEAVEGELKNIKQSAGEGGALMAEITFSEDTMTVKEPDHSKIDVKKYPIHSMPLITNSKNFCFEYGNYNGYPYLYMDDSFNNHIVDLKAIVTQVFPEFLETKVNYVDSLLDGDFQFREYIYYPNNFEYTGIVNVSGKSEKGHIKFLKIQTIEMNDSYSGAIYSDKTREYTFQDNKILVKEFVPEVPNEPVATKTFDYLYPVLLTNSLALGGKYSYDYSNIENPLSVPIKRKASLEGNQYGYIYFSPTTFDVSNYMSIITTPTDKPIVRKISFNNGFLDGDFDFKEDKIQFTGKANAGIIEEMKIKSDTEVSKEITNKLIHYDIITLVLKEDSYGIKYMSSKDDKVLEEIIPFSKNKKITNSENLATYENFAYCKTYQDLKNTLYNMKFIKKN